jgi:hypothetical protein
MPRDDDDDYDEDGDENQEEPEEKLPEYNYEELDEQGHFKKWDKLIWEEYQKAKKAHYDGEAGEEEEPPPEAGEEEADTFGLDEWTETFTTETHPNFDVNRVKLITTLGV